MLICLLSAQSGSVLLSAGERCNSESIYAPNVLSRVAEDDASSNGFQILLLKNSRHTEIRKADGAPAVIEHLQKASGLCD